ncbi:MAG: GxxExxY protein [Tannerellaceae bacterium]|nr:GxxExxY protein [Tannerellaceae bacterium]
MDREEYDKVCDSIIGAAIAVHRELGPGLLESVYEACLVKELQLRGLSVKSQVTLPVIYKGNLLDKAFILDLLVEEEIAVELKVVEDLLKVHEVQLLTYLRLAGKKLGLLINFNVPVLKQGIRRRINGDL